MNIDKDKLIKTIENCVTESIDGYWNEGRVCIGDFGKMQVQLVVTKTTDNFIKSPSEKFICLTNTKSDM